MTCKQESRTERNFKHNNDKWQRYENKIKKHAKQFTHWLEQRHSDAVNIINSFKTKMKIQNQK